MASKAEVQAMVNVLFEMNVSSKGYDYREIAKAALEALERVRIAESVTADVIKEYGREYYGS